MAEEILEVLLSEAEIAAGVKRLGEAIARDYEGQNPLFVGVLKGAVVFLADLIRATMPWVIGRTGEKRSIVAWASSAPSAARGLRANRWKISCTTSADVTASSRPVATRSRISRHGARSGWLAPPAYMRTPVSMKTVRGSLPG